MLRSLARLFRGHDRREHSRAHSDALRLRINGREYATDDWSLGGFRVAGYPSKVNAGDRVAGEIELAGTSPGGFVAEVVNRDENGHVGVRFLEISPQVLLAMSGLRGMTA